jgi:hypothetical protein
LKQWLVSTLAIQSQLHELVLLDNSEQRFSSAAKALNFGAQQANGDLLVFVHQDVCFKDAAALADLVAEAAKIENLGVAGVGGCDAGGKVFSSIVHGEPPIPAGHVSLTLAREAHTLDECILLVPKTVWHDHRFDEKTCDSWHLYGVDLSLETQRHGLKVVVLPARLHHRSRGLLTRSYFRGIRRVARKYRELGHIQTTMGSWSTNPLALESSIVALSLMAWISTKLPFHPLRAVSAAGNASKRSTPGHDSVV